MAQDHGASASQTGLSSFGSSPQAVSPADAASIPSADEIIEAVCRSLNPKLETLVHQFCDEAYGAIMESTQDYLCENALYNIGARLDAAERERKRLYNLAKANNDLARINLARAEKAERRLAQATDLIGCLVDNDPTDVVADNGATVFNLWRPSAERFLDPEEPAS